MKRRVVLRPQAKDDLKNLYSYIRDHGSARTAKRYTDRLRDYCQSFDEFGERGTLRPEFGPGIRTIGFERTATIAFAVETDQIVILAIFYRGREILL